MGIWRRCAVPDTDSQPEVSVGLGNEPDDSRQLPKRSLATLRAEVAGLAFGTAIAWLIGSEFGKPAPVIIIFLLGYSVWLLLRIQSVLGWLASGADVEATPMTIGLASEVLQQLHRQKKKTRKQKRRYRRMLAQFNSLASQLPDATVVIDSHQHIRWASDACLPLIGVEPEGDVGQRIDNIVRSPEFKEFLNSDADETELRSPMDRSITLALRRTHADETFSVLIAADITQRVKLREMRKVFVADVSHELRTPLTVIRGYIEMLKDADDINPRYREWLVQADAQSARMHSIIEDLLALSRLEARQLEPDEGDPINMAALVDRVVTPLVDTGNRAFELLVDESLLLRGSEPEIHSIASNLIGNAVKYAGQDATIRVNWYRDADGSACFRVEDNGPGIEQHHLERLSERFYRVDHDRSRDSGGTGLGLAIVKHAALMHEAELEIDSVPGSGAVFQVSFPAERIIEQPFGIVHPATV